jgi:hypothetical protein
MDGFLVVPRNQGRAGMTWELSHEWWLAEATPSSWGLQWFTRKPLGYSVEPQNRGWRLDEGVWPPRPVQPPRRDKSDRPLGGSNCPGRSRRETSKGRTRVGIARLALRLSKVSLWFPLIQSISVRFPWGRDCLGGNPGIPKVSLQSVGWIGRSGDGKLRVDPRPVFLGGAV